ncbi:MAG: heme exporter protein CcmD [Spongiibacteraceae bacterium]
MQFDSFSALMAMGGHGIYVWLVYGISFVVLLGLLVAPLRRDQQFFKQQKMLMRREQHAKQQVETGS